MTTTHDQAQNAALEAQLRLFKQTADENTADLCADERMLARVRARIARQPQPRITKPAWVGLAAVACLALMLLSGGFLLFKNHPLNAPLQQQARFSAQNTMLPTTGSAANPLALSASTATSYSRDGTPLPYGVAEKGDYVDGIAVAKGTNGLYGYVNEDDRWVVGAIYDAAEPVDDGFAYVTLEGETMQIVLD